MNEKFSHRSFDHIVGLNDAIKKHSSEIRTHIDNLLDQQGATFIEGYELKKTDREKEIIEFVSGEADRILKELGRKNPSEITQTNIHILKEGGTLDFTEGRLETGSHATKFGSVLVDRSVSEVQFALVLFHELIHMKVYKALQVLYREDGISLEEYKSGFSVTDRNGEDKYFSFLDEAVTGYLTQNFLNEVLKHSPMFTDEITHLQQGGNLPDISRMEELEFLNKLVDDLWEKNKDAYKSRDEVFALFVNAHVNGNLLPVGKLIERTLGKGSFRQLGRKNWDSR